MFRKALFIYSSIFIIIVTAVLGTYERMYILYQEPHRGFIYILIPILRILYLPTIYLLIYFIKNKYLRIFINFLFLLFIGINILMSIYFINRRIHFDVGFMYHNRKVAYQTTSVLLKSNVNTYIYILIILFLIISLNLISAYTTLLKNKKLKRTLIVILILSITINLVPKNNSLFFAFINFNFLRKSELRNQYNNKYESFISNKIINKPLIESSPFEKKYNIIILKLESLNSIYVQNGLTPNLIQASNKGYLFEKIYSASVQSIRSNEVMICGIPPSTGDTVYYSKFSSEIDKLDCIPTLLNEIDYDTSYFFSGLGNFDNNLKYASKMGFTNVYSDEIMRDEIKYRWGYKEDDYLNRYIEYMNMKQREPFMHYIVVGATNHYPFYPLYEYGKDIRVPYEYPKNTFEKLANTTFIQDKFIEKFINYYFNELNDDTYLIIGGDHPFPSGIHERNTFNEKGAYEENFLTSLVFIPPKDLYDPNLKITDSKKYSHIDIYTTFLSMIGVEKDYIEKSLGDSISEIFPQDSIYNTDNSYTLSIQPFDGGKIAFYENEYKYILDLSTDSVFRYNLESDPLEKNPVKIETNYGIELINKYFDLGY